MKWMKSAGCSSKIGDSFKNFHIQFFVANSSFFTATTFAKLLKDDPYGRYHCSMFSPYVLQLFWAQGIHHANIQLYNEER